jgi:transposase
MQNEPLRQIIREMQWHRFGRRAQTPPEDKMLLGLEDVEQTVAGDEAAADRRARRHGPKNAEAGTCGGPYLSTPTRREDQPDFINGLSMSYCKNDIDRTGWQLRWAACQ